MDWVYTKMCLRLLLVNNNVYSFLGGILISLSTNIFASLCLEKASALDEWNVYLASAFLAVASASCIVAATKMSALQRYLVDSQVTDSSERKEVIRGATQKKQSLWVGVFSTLLLSFLLGIVLLILNFIK